MREELDKQLCEKYPKIFKDRYGDMKETLMCWGFECGDGWYNIIDMLCGNIQHHIDWSVKNNQWDQEWNSMINKALAGDITELEERFKGYIDPEERMRETLEQGLREVRPVIPQVVAVQVKEKFGTLRFYVEGGDEYIRGLISMAESMSGVTCEKCGDSAQTNWPKGKNGGIGGWVHTFCERHEAEYQENMRSREMKASGLEE